MGLRGYSAIRLTWSHIPPAASVAGHLIAAVALVNAVLLFLGKSKIKNLQDTLLYDINK